jgi:hypothetical protein
MTVKALLTLGGFAAGFYAALRLEEGSRLNLNKWISEIPRLPGRLLT